MTELLWVLGISLSASFLCSILEAVFLSISHSYVGVLEEKDARAGRWMERMQRKIDEPIAAILTLNTIAHTLGATMGGALALEVFGDPWVTPFGAALTLVILLFSEILPKTLGATYWQALGRPAAYVLQAMIVGMKPIILPLSLFNRLITPGGERPTVSRAELEVLAEIGRREGTLDETEWKVLSNVMRLEEVVVAEVMTPRTDMVAIPSSATVAEAKDLMLDEGHLRLPVFEENLDTIAGILLARDLWRADRDGVEAIRDIVRPIHFAPSSKPVDDLIREMRTERVKMVIVLDEFGGTAGLATLEDLIEEIIGEIQDEHEADEPLDFQPLDGGDVRVWGGVPLREVNERLDLELPAEQHDTLGGFLFGQLSRVGKPGDVIEVKGGEFRITRMRGRRIEYAVFRPRHPRGDEVTAAD
ncbi:MAG TPA: hemolysin family protein [Longimicrobiales bacterium]|nr:hemolysin family protein [Longimicrobiales bacterium]